MSRSNSLHRFRLEALEPRILLSADGLAGAALADSKLESAIEVVQNPAPNASNGSDFNQLLTVDVAQNPRSAAAQIESIFGPTNATDSAATPAVTAPPANANAAVTDSPTGPASQTQAAASAVIAPATVLPAPSSEVAVTAIAPDAPDGADSIPSQLVETLHTSQGPPKGARPVAIS